jgi:hypothetical protein
MRRFFTTFLFLFAISGLLVPCLFVKAGTVDPDPTFTANNLLFDSDFANVTAMTVYQIQTFLEAKGSVLASINPNRLCGTSTSSCNNTKSAAQLIYDAAVLKDSTGARIGVNPAVIMVTMQKEQSLIKGTFGSSAALQYALDWAMGYSVYESGDRIEELKGFKQQLLGGGGYWGAPRSLRYNYSIGRGPAVNNDCIVPGSNNSVYNGNCHTFNVSNTTSYYDVPARQWINRPNKASMSLYRYTPHAFNGNYNFWYYWNQWFASLYNLKVASHLSVSPHSAVPGNRVTAKFSLINNNKVSLKLDRIKVMVYKKGGVAQDIPGGSNITIGPGETFSFANVTNTAILQNVGYQKAAIFIKYQGKWYTYERRFGARADYLTVRPLGPTVFYLNPALSFNPSRSIYTDESTTAEFTIYNNTYAPLYLERLKVSVWKNKTYYDFTGLSNRWLVDKIDFSQLKASPSSVGTWSTKVNAKLGGSWITPYNDNSQILKVYERR